MCSTVDTVKIDPEIAPSVAPAAMKPNSRLPCSEVKISTIICQKMETTNKLKIEVQMKKMRPTQMVCSGVAAYSASANSRMLALKKRYEIAMNFSRGKRLDQIGKRQIQQQHSDQRAGEQPLQIIDAARDPHLVADRDA